MADFLTFSHHLRYDPDSGHLFWKTPGRRRRIGVPVGCLSRDGYLHVGLNKKYYLAHRVSWMLYYGEWPAKHIDHINHLKTDNRIINLRQVSSQENGKNQKFYISNTSGAIGVSRHYGKWVANITVNGKRIYLGRFMEIEDAIVVRKKAEIKYGFHENHGSK